MPDFLRQILEQLRSVWGSLSRVQKTIFISVAAFVLAVLVSVGVWSSRSEFTVLFSKLEAADSGTIVEKLKEMNVEYRLHDEGKTILVPQEQVYDIRLKMAGDGLPKGGTVGFEVFEKAGFGVTAFRQKVDYLRALQGELERTITKFEEVDMARVHLVIPEDKLFVEDQKEPTASIIIGLVPGTQLSYPQIKAIANLAARSIEGLDPKDITIVDTDMNILSDVLAKMEDKDQLPTEITVAQEKVRQKFEKDYKSQIESMLHRVLGPNRSVARVFAEINFDKQEILSEVYKPVIGDEGIVRSTEETEEYYQGTGTLPGGIPGTASNIPGYQAKEEERTKADYEKRHTIKNYEISKDVITTRVAPGVIKRLSVSVFVDGLTDELVKTVEEVVAAAIGYNRLRGDQIVVRSLAFDRSVKDDMERRAQDASDRRQKEMFYSMVLLGGFGFLILLGLLIAFSRRRPKRSLVRFKPVEEEKLVEEMVVEETPPVEEEEPEPEPEPEPDKEEIVTNMAKTNPEEFALLLKTWLIASRKD